MTFVMREQSDWANPNYYFDQEQYNFLINKDTTLTIEETLCLESDRLDYILRNFEQVDPKLLDLLQYYRDEDWSNEEKEKYKNHLDRLNLFK